MKLEYVLTATNLHESYVHFIPIFFKTWKKLYPSVKVIIVVIAESIPLKYKEYEHCIRLFPPVEGVSTVFTSQFIRLLYPCILNSSDGVLVTDIDMLPMNRTYFIDSIKSAADDQFVYLRGNLLEIKKQMAICYNVARSSTWQEIFGVSSVEDIRDSFVHIAETVDINWFTDQLILYEYVTRWNTTTKRLFRVFDNTTGFNRLHCRRDTLSKFLIRKNISRGVYSDYHCLKPMTEYSKINTRIYYLLH